MSCSIITTHGELVSPSDVMLIYSLFPDFTPIPGTIFIRETARLANNKETESVAFHGATVEALCAYIERVAKRHAEDTIGFIGVSGLAMNPGDAIAEAGREMTKAKRCSPKPEKKDPFLIITGDGRMACLNNASPVLQAYGIDAYTVCDKVVAGGGIAQMGERTMAGNKISFAAVKSAIRLIGAGESEQPLSFTIDSDSGLPDGLSEALGAYVAILG